MKERTQKLVSIGSTFGTIFMFLIMISLFDLHPIFPPNKAFSQPSFKDYNFPEKFSFRYPQSWVIVDDLVKNDGTKTILFSKSGASKELPLLGTVSVRITLTNLYYRTSVNVGQTPTFENRVNVFMNSPNSSGLNVTERGTINGRRYVRIEGSQDQGSYTLKNCNYFIKYSEKLDLVIETAIVSQVSAGNQRTFTLDQNTNQKSVNEINAFISSLKIP